MTRRPVHGESANHSSLHPVPSQRRDALLAAAAEAQALRVELSPGDALFIPEGWWHQVTSASERGACGCGGGGAKREGTRWEGSF